MSQQKRDPRERVRDLSRGIAALAAIEEPRIAVLALAHALGALAFHRFDEYDREELLQIALREARFELRQQEALSRKEVRR